ncbi:BCCT family transporter [Peptoniphilus indolicus]|uniref:BCCT family betaine/carnitine/choline transporter n=2 Tax=Peptoniphilus indolicus TaxID=33030 RepID=G4D1Q0_9FIRM|nr:BCCT family transporter [Peptoniphilus indolicus]EGY80543.1 BCCT family betaine/carnitine/choline transporter [Peptoniphilus indolicus ATCC 29427]SUB75587.1 Glycine betaine transporter BetP [Peptoniphilus indolicus]
MKNRMRWPVFIPAFLFVLLVAIIGVVSNQTLSDVSNKFFVWSLESFGWLYQLLCMTVLIVTFVIMFSKIGNVRIGGIDAKPKYSFATYFAMTLTGGVATGIVTWGVNEPIIYLGNVWGELDALGIAANSPEAVRFAIARSFYNWTFVPYAIYALAGVIVAYVYFNKKEQLNVTATLTPLFGDKIKGGIFANIIDTLSMLAISIGLCSALTMCITLVTTGLKASYGFETNTTLFVALGIFIVAMFTLSSYVGLDKGLKKLADINAYFYYGVLILLLVTGPTLFILRNTSAGMAEWLHNFWLWGLDPIDIGGAPLVRSWTLFDFAFWVGYAPVTGIFLGQISYGRTIRECLIVNLILPSVFGIIWFGVWGNTAINMQLTGQADLIGIIQNSNAVMGLFEFMKHLPFAAILVPVNLFIILISFITSADATANNIASMCIKDIPIGSEAPGTLKVLWGATIGVIAIVMAAFGGGEQGVAGVKALAAAGGFVVLFIFILQVVSAIKMFFIDKIEE